jgi:hypothetical protein
MEKGEVTGRGDEKSVPGGRDNQDLLRQAVLKSIRDFHRMFTGELLAAALFLLLSIGGLTDFSILPSLSEHLRATLGKPPSANMISAVLLLYLFSAIILILSRMMSGSGKYGGFAHVGYIAGSTIFPASSRRTSGPYLPRGLPSSGWRVITCGSIVRRGLNGHGKCWQPLMSCRPDGWRGKERDDRQPQDI